VVDPHRARVMLNGLSLIPKQYVCAIGTLEPRKNLPTLLRAFRDAGIPELKLALVGDKGWRDGPLKEQLASMPESSVVLTGWLEDGPMRDLVANSAALLYPSIYEGFGFPPLEALALGVHVVSSALPPVLESCARQVTMVPALEPHAWVEALRALQKLPPRKPWAARTFDDVARDTIALYRHAWGTFQERQ